MGDPRWGGLARRAAGRLNEGGSGASSTWRDVMAAARQGGEGSAPDRTMDEWVRVPDGSDPGEGREPVRYPGVGGGPAEVHEEIRGELDRSVGADRAPRLEQRLRDATRAFSAERYTDAARILKKLAADAPRVAAVRELYGLTLYRQSRWRLAATELEAFRLLTSSTEQHPVLADCYRALGQVGTMEELWDELRSASPSAELVVEGRLVVAGNLADRGDLAGAIKLMEQGWKMPRRPHLHHLRRGYALADLYERAGDLARARELFSRLAAADPTFSDVRGRLRALR